MTEQPAHPEQPQVPETELPGHVDVLIVGAGLSGIGAACHLEDRLPGTSYLVVEARERMGGTWDLFRYPGVRSDSDMFTLGYRFRPWTDDKAIADGPAILDYVRETAREHGVEERIRYGLRVERAEWSTEDATWTVHGSRGGEPVVLRCGFLWSCSGYYRYDEGYRPELRGRRGLHRRRRHRGAPAALARGPRLRRQAGRRGRQRRDRGDAGAGDGHGRGRRRARDDAAALPDVHPGAAGHRHDRGRLRGLLPPKAAYAVTRWKQSWSPPAATSWPGAGRS